MSLIVSLLLNNAQIITLCNELHKNIRPKFRDKPWRAMKTVLANLSSEITIALVAILDEKSDNNLFQWNV